MRTREGRVTLAIFALLAVALAGTVVGFLVP